MRKVLAKACAAGAKFFGEKFVIEWDAGYGKYYWIDYADGWGSLKRSNNLYQPRIFESVEEVKEELPTARCSRHNAKIVPLRQAHWTTCD
jgi:hypothetical protein